MSSRIATREIREHRASISNSSKPNAMKERYSWSVPPPFIITHPDDVERIPIRNANHDAYQVLGTMTIWNKYVNLGYYIFDDCMQFHKIWKSTAKDSVTQRNKIIWNSFHFHRMHGIPPPAKLAISANKTALPYLKEKEPDFLLATDIEFEEKEFFAACNSSKPSLRHSSSDDSDDNKQDWTEVITKKTRRKSPPTSPTTIPKQTPTLYDNMDLSEHTINDLQQACITPIPPSTPDRKITTNHIPEPMNHKTDDTQTYMIHPGNLRKTSILTTTNDTDHNSITSTDSTKNYPALLTTTIDTQLSNPPKQHTFDDNHDHKNLLDNNHGYQKLGKTPAAQVKANCDQDGRQQTPNASVPSTTFRTNNTMTNDHFSTLSQTSSSTRDFIPVNDGTLRITVKWKPDKYASLKNDEDNWNAQAVEMLNDILHLPTMPIQLVPWSTTDGCWSCNLCRRTNM